MNEISDTELLRRLNLIKCIRLDYLKKYNLDKEDVAYSYSLLPNLDGAEYFIVDKNNKITWCKTVHSKTVDHYDPYLAIKYNRGEQQGYWGESEEVRGDFPKELGYILYENLAKKDFTDKCIYQKEKTIFKELIDFKIYSLDSDVKYGQKRIKDAIDKNNALKNKLEMIQTIRLE